MCGHGKQEILTAVNLANVNYCDGIIVPPRGPALFQQSPHSALPILSHLFVHHSRSPLGVRSQFEVQIITHCAPLSSSLVCLLIFDTTVWHTFSFLTVQMIAPASVHLSQELWTRCHVHLYM